MLNFLQFFIFTISINAQLFTRHHFKKRVCRPIYSKSPVFQIYLENLKIRLLRSPILNKVGAVDHQKVIIETVSCGCAKNLAGKIEDFPETMKLLLATQQLLVEERYSRFRKEKFSRNLMENLNYCYAVYWEKLD